jgi:hypothetical protein
VLIRKMEGVRPVPLPHFFGDSSMVEHLAVKPGGRWFESNAPAQISLRLTAGHQTLTLVIVVRIHEGEPRGLGEPWVG